MNRMTRRGLKQLVELVHDTVEYPNCSVRLELRGMWDNEVEGDIGLRAGVYSVDGGVTRTSTQIANGEFYLTIERLALAESS